MIDIFTYVFAELLFRGLCYPIGWPLVKLFTFGKYPTGDSWFADRAETQWTSAIGLIVLVAAAMIIFGQLELL